MGKGERLRPSNPSREARFDLVFFKRFLKICKLLFPSFKSQSCVLIIFLLLICLLQQVVIYYTGQISSKFYKIFVEKDEDAFIEFLPKAVGLVVANALILAIKTYVASVLYLTWRDSICRKLHEIYFKDILYYKINISDKKIDNPDQRMTQDVDRMCRTFSNVLVPIIISPFTIGYYLYKCYNASGLVGPVSTAIFFFVFTIINKLFITPVARSFYIQERKEGDFRFKHMQIRTYAESAAFYRSGKLEKMKTNKKLSSLIATQHKLIRWEFLLNGCIYLADYLGSILSYIAIAFPLFLGHYDSLSSADLASLISLNSFYSIYLINCFTKLIDQASEVSDVVGAAHRIGQLSERLEKLNGEQNEDFTFVFDDPPGNGDLHRMNSCNSLVAYDFQDVTYGLPKSTNILYKNLSLQLKSGINILVTGDSGCGKTSLLRVTCGLWKYISGHIDKNVHLGPNGLLCLPQKPYFTDGTLREQITFPLKDCETIPDEPMIYKYLELFGLNGLLDRLGGLDVDAGWNWYDEMSPGEMQRLSFVRLFYHHPRFALLDEATSQVSQEMEQLLYNTCKELGITFLSVGHRSTVRQFHDVELKMQAQGIWSMHPLQGMIINETSVPL